MKNLFKKIPDGRLKHFASMAWHFGKHLVDGIIIRLKYGRSVQLMTIPAVKLADLSKKGYRSQFGQDYVINSQFFGNKRGLTFVDVGANHPIRNSNSYFFEKVLGWRVIAIDAQADFKPEWDKCRDATFVNACVGAEVGLEDFIQYKSPTGWEDQLSCVSSLERPEDKSIDKRVIKVDVIPLSQILSETNVRNVDVLSIDVEGFEPQVLSGIDFNKIRPKVILVENCRVVGGDGSIRRFMSAKGYKFTMRIWTTDDVYIDAEH